MKKFTKKILAIVLASSLLIGFSASVASFAAESYAISQGILGFVVNNIKVGDANSESNEIELVTYGLQIENSSKISIIYCNTEITALHIPGSLGDFSLHVTKDTILDLKNVDLNNLKVFLLGNVYDADGLSEAIKTFIDAGIKEENIIVLGKG